jgi:hypothetical protein
MYGRACVLHAGSLELLDLIGIYDYIADTGFIARLVCYAFGVAPATHRSLTIGEQLLSRMERHPKTEDGVSWSQP